MKSYQQFFAELKRRKVFRVMAVYGGGGFVVLEAGDLLVDTFQLSAQLQTAIGILIILGFPFAIILAWAFEITPDGMQRKPDADDEELEQLVAAPAAARWASGLLALFGTVALAAGIWLSVDARREDQAPVGDAAANSADVRLVFVDPSVDPRPSLAVLPFADLSPQGDQAYFSDGMTEEILNVLAKIRDLRVAARTSVFALRDRELTARQWGDTLHVQYFVEGSVRKSGDMVRITAQLIDTSDGSHLWTDNFDRPLANIFQIQSEIAEAIAEQLRVPLGIGDAADLVRPTADLEAYDLYLAGREQIRRRGSGVAEAVTLFEAAIARDSTWAPAWAGLAEGQSLIPYYGATDSARWATHLGAAETAALKALELDPGNASAAVALGNVYRDRWDWTEAEDAYIRALTSDPGNVEAHQQYAEYLSYVGRLGEALQAAERALALARSPIRLNSVGYLSSRNGLVEDAIEYLEEAARLDPDEELIFVHYNLLRAYLAAGRWGDWWTGLVKRMESGSRTGAADTFRAMWPEPGPPPDGLDPLELPWVSGSDKTRLLIVVGQHERALARIERRYGNRVQFGGSDSLFDPRFDPIRDDPRFKAALASRGLAGRVPIRAQQP